MSTPLPPTRGRQRSCAALAALVASSMAVGCTTTFDLPVSEAPHLDWRERPREPTVVTVTGQTKALDEDFTVSVDRTFSQPPGVKCGGCELPGLRFSSPIVAGIEAGFLIMGPKASTPFAIPLSTPVTLKVKQSAPGKTAALVLGVTCGVAFVVLVIYAIANSLPHSTAGNSGGIRL